MKVLVLAFLLLFFTVAGFSFFNAPTYFLSINRDLNISDSNANIQDLNNVSDAVPDFNAVLKWVGGIWQPAVDGGGGTDTTLDDNPAANTSWLGKDHTFAGENTFVEDTVFEKHIGINTVPDATTVLKMVLDDDDYTAMEIYQSTDQPAGHGNPQFDFDKISTGTFTSAGDVAPVVGMVYTLNDQRNTSVSGFPAFVTVLNQPIVYRVFNSGDHNNSPSILSMYDLAITLNLVKTGDINATPVFADPEIVSIGMSSSVGDQVTSSRTGQNVNIKNTAYSATVSAGTNFAGAGDITRTNKAYNAFIQKGMGNMWGNSKSYAYFVEIVQDATENWGFYNDTDVNNFMGKDNSETFLGTGNDASINWDGTNLVFDTNKTREGYAWFSGGISAESYITRTAVWDKEKDGAALDSIKTGTDYLTDGKIDHEKFSEAEQADYLVKDPNNCWVVKENTYWYILEEATNEKREQAFSLKEPLKDWKTFDEIKRERIETRETIECGSRIETGQLLTATIAKHEEALFELNQKVEQQKIEIANLCTINPLCIVGKISESIATFAGLT